MTFRFRVLVASSLFFGATIVTPPASQAAVADSVRIGVAVEQHQVSISASKPAVLLDGSKVLTEVKPFQAYLALSSGRGVLIKGPKGETFGPSVRLTLRPHAVGEQVPLVLIGQKWYRGEADLIPGAGGTVTGINRLPLQDYLYGVVPAEMPASWPIEALKAQAVAARTYTVTSLGKEASKGYDLCDTVHCHVYGGAAVERASSNQAVADTAGEIVTWGGKLIRAYYHSSSGGYTDSGEDVWQMALPYIQPVKDYDQESPKFVWNKRLSPQQLQQALRKLGRDVGPVGAVQATARTRIGRVTEMKLTGPHGSVVVDAYKFRLAAGLNSTFFNVGPVNGLFQFAGRGYGHGLGMSQWGARGMAKQGFAHQQILSHYYAGIQLAQLDQMWIGLGP